MQHETVDEIGTLLSLINCMPTEVSSEQSMVSFVKRRLCSKFQLPHYDLLISVADQVVVAALIPVSICWRPLVVGLCTTLWLLVVADWRGWQHWAVAWSRLSRLLWGGPLASVFEFRHRVPCVRCDWSLKVQKSFSISDHGSWNVRNWIRKTLSRFILTIATHNLVLFDASFLLFSYLLFLLLMWAEWWWCGWFKITKIKIYLRLS